MLVQQSMIMPMSAAAEWKPKARRGDHADLVVQPFDDAVGAAPADIGHDISQVRADGASDLDESGEPAATRPAQPLGELGRDHLGLPPAQDIGKRFLE